MPHLSSIAIVGVGLVGGLKKGGASFFSRVVFSSFFFKFALAVWFQSDIQLFYIYTTSQSLDTL